MRQDENERTTLEKEDNGCRKAIERMLDRATPEQLEGLYNFIKTWMKS